MITNPKHGWCNFNLGTFEGHPSYLTDVPVDLLEAFIDYHTKGCGIAWFDEEGTEFSLILTPNACFVLEEKDEPVLHNFSILLIEDLENELIEDLETHLHDWGLFLTSDDEKDISQHESEITHKIELLKEIRR